MDDLISRRSAIDAICTEGTRLERNGTVAMVEIKQWCVGILEALPSAQPERKTGRWILDRSGAYCCDNCMEPCATYAMMKPRDKFCKMCGSRNEVME